MAFICMPFVVFGVWKYCMPTGLMCQVAHMCIVIRSPRLHAGEPQRAAPSGSPPEDAPCRSTGVTGVS